jgi:hypothetical protein
MMEESYHTWFARINMYFRKMHVSFTSVEGPPTGC